MKLNENEIQQLVSDSLSVFTNGVIFRDSKVYITLNFPDGEKESIEGEWRHMSDSRTLFERVKMLQNIIYEEFSDFHFCIPREWAR
ncbi:hypothetical protein [Pantoea cypripedii]|uniref:Uncharacterized protein n=1 Tax=Pantoea cypripedii TaxID=55209 RepID=A0A1X1EML4_PANCY|nr:hypothetical protein [Pantoea cypripedii]MBP2199265.1 hypothetical protein [Pantoea cypripedii]ORM90052.1 hypothetical protein HA50_26130 [Pantoea cypripedii]